MECAIIKLASCYSGTYRIPSDHHIRQQLKDIVPQLLTLEFGSTAVRLSGWSCSNSGNTLEQGLT